MGELTSPSPLDHALALAGQGLAVFPCRSTQGDSPKQKPKSPLTRRGFKDASTDPERIRAWWREHPDALVGLRTGGTLLVVDVDPEGLPWYESDVARFECSRVHKTRRGWHLLYAMPAEKIGNDNRALPNGVDVRGDGGYIIFWPAHGLAATGGLICEITPPPQWLVDAILSGKRHPTRITIAAPSPSPSSPPAAEPISAAEPTEPVAPVAAPRSFHRRVNDEAMKRLRDWVPALLPQAEPYHAGYRVASDALGRDLQEDLSITPEGIVDFGVADMGDPRAGKRTPIDLCIQFLSEGKAERPSASDAAIWLCQAMGLKPEDIGYVEIRFLGDVKSDSACTDLANAERIAKRFGAKLMVAAGRCYSWAETHWQNDEGEVFRNCARVAELVLAEAQSWLTKPSASAEERKSHEDIAGMLMKWAARCEMKSVIDACFGLLRKLLDVPIAHLDADPWLLNCSNGTVDLRTGQIRAHDPRDRITRVAPTRFDPQATRGRFESFLRQITGDNQPVQNFIRRWFGYCGTGSVREQRFLVLVGAGANGKSTLINAIDDVLGPYSAPAPPNLLTGGNDRHPTEIADLLGRRLITASENEDGALLRESFVKQITGGDQLKARVMRGDFFEFRPTFKLQLLTNHLPQIKGTDFAIWRRTVLLKFPVRFGTVEDIAAGRADQPRDETLHAALVAEREGILAWLVAGAGEWFRDGLRPPDSVLADGIEYQDDQDRTREFIQENCSVGDGKSATVAALFAAYSAWCKSVGYQPQGSKRFITDLARVIPGLRRTKRSSGPANRRRHAAVVEGLELTEYLGAD